MAPVVDQAALAADVARRQALMARVAAPTTIPWGPEELVQDIRKGTFISPRRVNESLVGFRNRVQETASEAVAKLQKTHRSFQEEMRARLAATGDPELHAAIKYKWANAKLERSQAHAWADIPKMACEYAEAMIEKEEQKEEARRLRASEASSFSAVAE